MVAATSLQQMPFRNVSSVPDPPSWEQRVLQPPCAHDAMAGGQLTWPHPSTGEDSLHSSKHWREKGTAVRNNDVAQPDAACSCPDAAGLLLTPDPAPPGPSLQKEQIRSDQIRADCCTVGGSLNEIGRRGRGRSWGEGAFSIDKWLQGLGPFTELCLVLSPSFGEHMSRKDRC